MRFASTPYKRAEGLGGGDATGRTAFLTNTAVNKKSGKPLSNLTWSFAQVRKRIFLRHFSTKNAHILPAPRQARDKHRETSPKRVAFSCSSESTQRMRGRRLRWCLTQCMLSWRRPCSLQVRKNGFLVHFQCQKITSLPRQARDKQREHSQKDSCVSCVTEPAFLKKWEQQVRKTPLFAPFIY